MAQDFYPFVDNGTDGEPSAMQVRHPARIAVYDDVAAAPRVVVVEPKDVRAYLEEITLQVTNLAAGQGGTIPFMVIREIVENFIHAYFMEPTISILDHGNTIRFSDQGPGIPQKERALQYGTSSATEEMRHYIRGVGSGLPYAQQYMVDKGGSLEIDDNIQGGTVVTLSAVAAPEEPPLPAVPQAAAPMQAAPAGYGYYPQQAPQYPQAYPPQQMGYQQQAWPQQQVPSAAAYPVQPSYAPQQPAQSAPAAWPQLSARSQRVLDYLSTHDAVGPSDLTRTYGESQPTWTRELQALEEAGYVRKDGQKRRLTAMGRAFLFQG